MSTNCPKVLFYEWSDITRQPIGFLKIEDFIMFCNVHNIIISPNHKRYINVGIENEHDGIIYAVCEKDNNKLVLSCDYKGLRKNFNKHCNGR